MFRVIYDTGKGKTNGGVSLVKPNITPEIRGNTTQPPFIIHGRHSAALILLDCFMSEDEGTAILQPLATAVLKQH